MVREIFARDRSIKDGLTPGFPHLGFRINMGGLPTGGTGTSLPTWLRDIFNGALGNLFSGGTSYAGSFGVPTYFFQLNTATFTASAPPPPPPLSGAGTSSSVNSNAPVGDSICEKMAKGLQSAINTTLKDLEKKYRMNNHGSLDLLVNGASLLFRKFYAGDVFYSATGTAPPDQFAGVSGFRPEFRDAFWPSEDQTHHFAAYFYVGTTSQWGKAWLHKQTDTNNPGDLALGNAAYLLGNSLGMQQIGTQTVMRGRFEIPNPVYEGPAMRFERILGIANAVRAKICE